MKWNLLKVKDYKAFNNNNNLNLSLCKNKFYRIYLSKYNVIVNLEEEYNLIKFKGVILNHLLKRKYKEFVTLNLALKNNQDNNNQDIKKQMYYNNTQHLIENGHKVI